MSRPALVIASLAAALPLLGCPDPVDKAAKKRIFSPEEPPKAVLAAAEPIDLNMLASDPALTRRVLGMSAHEAVERIGPHKFTATASFDWSWLGQKVSLSEKRKLEQLSAQEFHLYTENDRDHGLELLRTAGQTFAKSRYHKYRERKRDRGQTDKLREDAFQALRSADAILGHRLALSPDGEEHVRGRVARRFIFKLADAAHAGLDENRDLPAPQFPSAGPDPDTKRRLDFATLRLPKSVEGRIWIDSETGVPLKSTLTAVVTGPKEIQGESSLTLSVQTELTVVEKDKLALAVPKDYLPDEDRPDGIAAAVDRFGVQRSDAGTPGSTAGAQDEPESGEE